jgi:hypothetical protein
MTNQEIERIYEAIAEMIDQVGPEKSELFLAKLSLLVASETNDVKLVLTCIDDAAKHL